MLKWCESPYHDIMPLIPFECHIAPSFILGGFEHRLSPNTTIITTPPVTEDFFAGERSETTIMQCLPCLRNTGRRRNCTEKVQTGENAKRGYSSIHTTYSYQSALLEVFHNIYIYFSRKTSSFIYLLEIHDRNEKKAFLLAAKERFGSALANGCSYYCFHKPLRFAMPFSKAVTTRPTLASECC